MTKLCLSPTRSAALRVMQALVLAGADASGIIKEIEEGSDAEDLRSVVGAELADLAASSVGAYLAASSVGLLTWPPALLRC